MAVPARYRHIDFTPTAEIARYAAEGLRLRRKFGRGGTPVGFARARDLQNRKTLSPDTIKRMVSFFARHEVDKRGRNFGNPERPSNGLIAWLLWGGDPAKEWANRLRRAMKEADAQPLRRLVHYFYFARCNDGSLYAGTCLDLAAREAKHNDGTGAKYTRSRAPVKIIYHETFPTLGEARSREALVKGWSKEEKEALVRTHHKGKTQHPSL